MEERNLELDDDGKIKVRKKNEGNFAEESGETGDDIVIDIPDFAVQEDAADEPILSDDELEKRGAAWDAEMEKRKTDALRLYEEGEALYAAGDFDGAGEKFLDSVGLYNADWRPWFGVVRVQTKDLTDFSDVYACEQAYARAFKRMPKSERALLAEKYVPSLTERAEECAKQRERFTEQDVSEREAVRGDLEKAYIRTKKILLVALIVFAVLAAAGIVLAPFINTVPGWQILIPDIICFALAVVALAYLAVCLRRFILARGAYKTNLRAGTTEAGAQARVFAEEEELLRSVIEDFTK